tara:strand:+ start:31 stop:270 length:240 start_codon:yes stop_codon:yes gene_type:complete
MDALNILSYVLLFYIGLILAGLLMAMVMGCVALIINERRTFCCCFYCETKKANQEKDRELSEVIIIIEPNGDKKLGIKN